MKIIDTFQIFPYVLISSVTYGFFFFAVINSILEHKNKISTKFIFLSFAASRFLIAVLKANLPVKYMPLVFLLDLAAFTLIIFLFYSDKASRKITAVMCGFLSYLLVLFLGGFVTRAVYTEQIKQEAARLAVNEFYLFDYIFSECWIFCNACIVAFLIKIVQNKAHIRAASSNKYAFLLLLPVSHLLLFVIILWALLFSYQDLYDFPLLYNVLFSVMLTIAALDIITFFVAEKMEKTDIQNKLYEKQLLQNKLDYNEVVFTNKNKEELRKIRHDMNNVLLTARSLIETEKYSDAVSLLNNATEDLSSVEGVPLCSDSTLNALLSIKKQQAEKLGADLCIEIEENSALNISNYDICRIIGNLIDNGVEAVGSESDKTVLFKIRISENTVFIKTENSCACVAKKNYREKNRGNGQNIIRETVKKYNGNFTFDSSSGVYLTETTLVNTDTGE